MAPKAVRGLCFCGVFYCLTAFIMSPAECCPAVVYFGQEKCKEFAPYAVLFHFFVEAVLFDQSETLCKIGYLLT